MSAVAHRIAPHRAPPTLTEWSEIKLGAIRRQVSDFVSGLDMLASLRSRRHNAAELRVIADRLRSAADHLDACAFSLEARNDD